VLYGNPCGGTYTGFIADQTSTGGLTSTSTFNVQQLPMIAGMDYTGEEQSTLTSDGLTIIATNTAHTSFVAATRSAIGSNAWVVNGSNDYVNITVAAPASVNYVYISPDDLALYYNVQGSTTLSQNGIYESVRPSTSVPFPAGTMMNATVQANLYVTATSIDRMTLFLQTNNFGTVVLSRTSLQQQFANPNTPNAAPTAPGYRIRPLANCQTLVGTCNYGCSNEVICIYQ
jgi:hypothetical protein